MTKGQLITRKDGYPFVYFTEKAFRKEQVVSLITKTYELELEAGVTPIAQPHNTAMRDTFLLLLGKVGRIVHLGEDHVDLFFAHSTNEYIRELAIDYNNDLIQVTEQLMASGIAIGADKAMMDAFEQDIKTVYDTEYMFYLDSAIPYDSMRFFAKEGDPSPFCEANIRRFFRNIPFVRVW